MVGRQAAVDSGDAGVSGAVGTAVELARDGPGVRCQLGGRLSLGAVAGRVGVGPSHLGIHKVQRSLLDFTSPGPCSRAINAQGGITI